MKPDVTKVPLITLIGDESENFYQLGLNDRDTHSDTLTHIRQLLSLPVDNPLINQVMDGLMEEILERTFRQLPYFREKCQAYAEGLARPVSEVVAAFVVPELMSSVSKWLPGINTHILGCSSYFAWDEAADAPLHGRILDFPLIDSFDSYERGLLTHYGKGPRVFSMGTAGFPFHGITSMNEEGMTVALHQKFTDKLNRNGYPIFELMHRMMQECGDRSSAQDFLRKNPTITTWGLYCSFSDGSILRADVAGEEHHFQVSRLEPGKVLYFNNTLENKKWENPTYIPQGFPAFCEMRKSIAHKKILELQKSKNITDVKLLKAMSLPWNQRKDDANNLKMDPLTCSSLGIYVMNATDGKVLSVGGEAPKYFRGHYTSFQNLWKEPSSCGKTATYKTYPENLFEGYRQMMLGQKAFDYNNMHMVYHHLQMAEADFDNLPDRYVARFYFMLVQGIFEPSPEILPQLLLDFQDLLPHLPQTLQDHGKLMIARLEWFIYGKSTVNESDFEGNYCRQVFTFEEKVPRFILGKLLKWAVIPRVDLWDVMYAHVRPNH